MVLIQDNRQVFKDNAKVGKSSTNLHTHHRSIYQHVTIQPGNQAVLSGDRGSEAKCIQQAFEIYSREIFHILTYITEPKIDKKVLLNHF